MNGNEAIGLLLELFTWIGLSLAALTLFLIMIVRAVDGSWVPTDAVLLTDGDAVEARWMTSESSQSRRLDAHEIAETGSADSATVYYSLRAPERMRLHRLSTGERILRLLFIIMASIGVAASVVSLVMLAIHS
ncbi:MULTISPECIES: hypothetical protein [unclassified Salinibacterium]|uniref:hypothetical protein n=1 Tax=unclassified Salinibacterium TaxID=2632331 RepID=UPI00141E7D08|nr:MULTISPECIES: hypothetical protein [unclassified Salinibacterium]